MGCDIHVYREKKVNDTWVTADKWVEEYGDTDVPWENRFTDRNYQLLVCWQAYAKKPLSRSRHGASQ